MASVPSSCEVADREAVAQNSLAPPTVSLREGKENLVRERGREMVTFLFWGQICNNLHYSELLCMVKAAAME